MTRTSLAAILVAYALLGSAPSAHGQGDGTPQTKTFGLIGGVDFSTLTGSGVNNTKNRTGFTGGAFFGVMVNNSVEVEPEILYAMKGTSFTDTDTTLALDYIEIPILVKLHLQPDGGMYLLAGPAVDFNVSCKATAASSTDCSALGLSPNLTFGGVLGLGYSHGRIGIEGRYDFDFSDALAVDQFSNLDAKNRVWAILLRISR